MISEGEKVEMVQYNHDEDDLTPVNNNQNNMQLSDNAAPGV
jgi:hypothetical protein